MTIRVRFAFLTGKQVETKAQVFLLIFLLASSCAQGQTPVSLPLEHVRVTSPFGYRIHPLTGKWQFHSGVDLAARREPVKSILAGVVIKTGYDPCLGNFVWIDHGEGARSLYGHLYAVRVSQRERLAAGQVIGTSGGSGRVTAEHLHLAVSYRGRWVSPMKFLYGLLRAAGNPN
jgi:murein DD-endopeptidase MepM/ murein hydrolase activator NlpD